MTRTPPAWLAEARALHEAGATPADIARKLGKKPWQVNVALDIDGARGRANAAHRRSRAAKRDMRPAEPTGAPIAGSRTPREALQAALLAYDAGAIGLGEMVRRMTGVGL